MTSATASAPAPSIPAVALSPTVGPEQIRFFVENGFLAVPGLVNPGELAALEADLLKIARGGYPCEGIKPAAANLSDREVFEGILCIHQPHYVSPVITAYVKHAGICDVLSKVTGAHLADWNGAVKCMQSMSFVKGPGKPGQAWHQDEQYIPTRDRSLIGAWIAIDDATMENGCLWVVPGSHKHGYLYPRKPPTDLDEYDGSDCCYDFDESKAVPVPVSKGTVVFFNGYLLHRSLKNRSNGFRRVLVNHYMSSWSLLPWSQCKNDESVGINDCRNIITVSGQDPYLSQKPVTTPPNAVYLRGFGKKWSE